MKSSIVADLTGVGMEIYEHIRTNDYFKECAIFVEEMVTKLHYENSVSGV